MSEHSEFEDDSDRLNDLINVVEDTETGNLMYYVNAQAITPHQYAMILHDLVRRGAILFNVDPEVIWKDFDQERQVPEVKQRTYQHGADWVTETWRPPSIEH